MVYEIKDQLFFKQNFDSKKKNSEKEPLESIKKYNLEPKKNIPEFAIIGHPNEGKSSVVSTLAEDDSIAISPIPGETIVCQVLPVIIDGEEVIRFIDTPGFQNPRETLAWMQKYSGPDELLLKKFIEIHSKNPDFRDECELLSPVANGAGVIFVVDGSRPVRQSDRIEMEILRMTGSPRMSIVNCKGREPIHLNQWKNEFRKHFNSIRQFNAHKATWSERIELLESLKSVDQEWQPALTKVIESFRQDWKHRNILTAAMGVEMLEHILTFSITSNIGEYETFNDVKSRLEKDFCSKVEAMEQLTHQKIRKLFKHNIFNCQLPANSILHETLFSKKTWQFLGLSPKEVAFAAAMVGGATGVVVDVIAAGISFGVFSAIGGILGAGSALLSGRRIADLKFKGVKLGKDQVKVGPISNIQLMYILLDRMFIFYRNIINWAHARREVDTELLTNNISENIKRGVTSGWSDADKKVCNLFFQSICGNKSFKYGKQGIRKSMEHLIFSHLDNIK
ncbi:MAG: GTPase/DUF3482 domain-containing protein [Desulfamplus sp.]|nr:GTPase/DUF3482 domain-containing protein [Desulfamplus sp.]